MATRWGTVSGHFQWTELEHTCDLQDSTEVSNMESMLQSFYLTSVIMSVVPFFYSENSGSRGDDSIRIYHYSFALSLFINITATNFDYWNQLIFFRSFMLSLFLLSFVYGCTVSITLSEFIAITYYNLSVKKNTFGVLILQTIV